MDWPGLACSGSRVVADQPIIPRNTSKILALLIQEKILITKAGITMEKQLLNCFQLEVVRQCRWAILAIEDLEEALKGLTSGKLAHEYGMSRLWMSIQTFLVAVGNISKLLWPSQPQLPDRGPDLRASLGVGDTSCLKTRTFRNHFEHFDERLETFFLSLKPSEFFYVDANVSPGGINSLATGIDQNKVLRHFDQESWRLIFRGECYELEPLYKEIVELYRKADAVARER
jgi:hypothetical protein